MTSMTFPQTNYNKSLLPSIPKLLHISTKTNAMID